MTEKLPPYPKIRKDRGLTVGPGVYWWKVWKEYHDDGGILGYRSWIEALRELDKQAKKEERRKKK